MSFKCREAICLLFCKYFFFSDTGLKIEPFYRKFYLFAKFVRICVIKLVFENDLANVISIRFLLRSIPYI